MRRFGFQYALCLLLLVLAGNLRAQSLQPLQPIRDAALAALQANASATAMLAPGLRLAACAQPLAAVRSGPSTAEVSCPDNPGWRLFVPVRGASAQAPLIRNLVQPEILVKRGDPVMLHAQIGGIVVRMHGRALGRAAAGAVLNVENTSSHRIVRGRLAEDGTVEVLN